MVKQYPSLFQEYVRKIIGFFNGRVAIVLYGSRGSGRFRESSDYDIAVIVKECSDPIELAIKLLKMRPKGLPVDIAVLELQELEDGIVRKMLSPGKILFNGLNQDIPVS